MAAATDIILIAGGLTFTNEWLQTKQINWKVPVATVLIAAVFDGIAHLDAKVATGVAVIVLIGALTVPIDGKSPVQEIGNFLNNSTPKKTTRVRR